MFEFICMILYMFNICTHNFRTDETMFLQFGKSSRKKSSNKLIINITAS